MGVVSTGDQLVQNLQRGDRGHLLLSVLPLWSSPLLLQHLLQDTARY